MSQIAIIGAVTLNTPSTSSNHATPVLFQARVQMENETPILGFEEWLAGINERISLLMNYQLLGTPAPLVHICFFIYGYSFCFVVILRVVKWSTSRIFSRIWCWRRLSHSDQLPDASPKKTLTKHVWKITDMLQLLHIFSCSLVTM